MSRTASTPSATHYEILQVAPTASLEKIKESFYRLAKTCHPDKLQLHQQNQPHHGGTVSSFQTEKDIDQKAITTTVSNPRCSFHDIQTSWEVLRDVDRRAAYDIKLQSQQLQEQRCRNSALPIKLTELEEGVDEEDSNQTLWIIPCRCGEEIILDDATRRGMVLNQSRVMGCPGCCFTYRIVE